MTVVLPAVETFRHDVVVDDADLLENLDGDWDLWNNRRRQPAEAPPQRENSNVVVVVYESLNETNQQHDRRESWLIFELHDTF